jgi:prepilin-type N-terminal cleavage/methylation domain-containing protein
VPVRSDRRGFTIVEVVVASLVMLIVLGTLAFAVRFFVMGSRQLDNRRSALMIASSEMISRCPEGVMPPVGESSHAETAGNLIYLVETIVTEIEPGVREVQVIVSEQDSDTHLTRLVRRCYGR